MAFVVLQNMLLSGLFLMLGGLLTIAVLLAVYDITVPERARRTVR